MNRDENVSTDAASVLAIRGISKSFGGLRAVADVSLSCREGECLGIIGPNGAGKSTLFSLIAGASMPDSGTVIHRGTDISRRRSHGRAQAGIIRTFQIPRPFSTVTVRENLMAGAYLRHPQRNAARARAEQIAADFGFADLWETTAENLNVAEQKRLELARAYAAGPDVLLLDEVGAGLSRPEQVEYTTFVKRINDEGVTVLFVEHVIPIVTSLAHRLIALDQGRVIAEGEVHEVLADPAVVTAYLGSPDA